MRIKNGRVLNGEFDLVNADILLEGDTISRVGTVDGEADVDASGLTVIPGLIDIHTHGCGEYEGYDGGGAAAKTARTYAENGTTSFLPTSRGMDLDRLVSVTAELAEFIENGVAENFAQPLGIHLEGPFISAKKRGAHPTEYLLPPCEDLFNRLREAGRGHISIISLAPELEGGMELISSAKEEMTVSVAHTAADYGTAMEAFARGATHVTHLFNAMNPYGHREPGVIGAAFDSQEVTAELICDGVHLHPATLRLAFKALGADRAVLVSDSVAGAGLDQGEYVFRGERHKRDGGKAVRLIDGTLAGGGGFLLDNVRSAVEFGIPFTTAVKAASLNPARVIRRESRLGSIAPDKQADLLLLDGDLNLKGVILRGRLLFLEK